MSAQLQIPQIQYTLDDELARRARDEAIARVGQNAQEAWRAAALDAVKQAARTHAEFTTDEVLEIMRAQPYATHEGRAWGAVMTQAARLGWIVKTGRVRKSAAVSRHYAEKAVWRSLLIGG